MRNIKLTFLVSFLIFAYTQSKGQYLSTKQLKEGQERIVKIKKQQPEFDACKPASKDLIRSFFQSTRMKWAEGDVSYWFEQQLSIERINLELVIRRNNLDDLDPAKLGNAEFGKKYKEKKALVESYWDAKTRCVNAQCDKLDGIKNCRGVPVDVNGEFLNMCRETKLKVDQHARTCPGLQDLKINLQDIIYFADYLGLFCETQINPHLGLMVGDFSNMIDQGWNIETITNSLIAYKAVLSDAEAQGVFIKDTGTLGYLRDRLLNR